MVMLQSEENPPNSALHLRKAALAYAARGWYVFPCLVGGKTPVFKGGFHGATTNPAVIERWWGGQALQYRHRYWPHLGPMGRRHRPRRRLGRPAADAGV